MPTFHRDERRGVVDGVPRVRPCDTWYCHGCGLMLDFDSRGFVAADRLAACRSRCDWELVERPGPQTEGST